MSDYWDELLNTDSGGNTDAQDSANLDAFDADVAAALELTGIDIEQAWVGGITKTAAYAQRQGVNEPAPKAVAPESTEKGGILGKISGFVEKNKALSEMLIKGVAGAASGNTAKKAAEIQARNRLDELKLKNQQEQEGNARTSASVTGLRQPTGILNRGPLRRTDGTPIYTNGRIV